MKYLMDVENDEIILGFYGVMREQEKQIFEQLNFLQKKAEKLKEAHTKINDDYWKHTEARLRELKLITTENPSISVSPSGEENPQLFYEGEKGAAHKESCGCLTCMMRSILKV